MARNYTLPEKRLDEDNWAWCQRAAASIPAEEICRELVAFLHTRKKRRRVGREPWSVIGGIMGLGSGVSNAIVERFTRPEAERESDV